MKVDFVPLRLLGRRGEQVDPDVAAASRGQLNMGLANYGNYLKKR